MSMPVYENVAHTKNQSTVSSNRKLWRFGYYSSKRIVDLVLAGLLIVCLLPCLIIVACAIRLESSGPSLFRQRRAGLSGKPFYIYKFRTMTVQEDGDLIPQANRYDERVTRLGRFLRRTSIDELPQLLNVLRGEMSLVGPRPHALAHDKYYSHQIAEYSHRFAVRPGITGWAQVNGARGETPTIDHMRRRVELDLWYIAHASLGLDLKILFWTLIALVVRNEKVY